MEEQLDLHVLSDSMMEVDGHITGVLRHLVWHVLVLHRHGAKVPSAHAEEHFGPREHLVEGRGKSLLWKVQVRKLMRVVMRKRTFVDGEVGWKVMVTAR